MSPFSARLEARGSDVPIQVREDPHTRKEYVEMGGWCKDRRMCMASSRVHRYYLQAGRSIVLWPDPRHTDVQSPNHLHSGICNRSYFQPLLGICISLPPSFFSQAFQYANCFTTSLPLSRLNEFLQMVNSICANKGANAAEQIPQKCFPLFLSC